MGLVLKPLEPAGARAWDEFVRSRPDGTFFHLTAWRAVIERAFGHSTHYTMAEQDGAVVGVLPLAHVKTRLFGNTLVSLPFCVYGGPLAVDADTTAALESYADDMMRNASAHAVEFRHRDQSDSLWIERPELYVTFRKPIEADPEKNLKAIPRKQRAMVRKGMQNGLVSVVTGETDVLHRVYSESVRNLGTPVFPRRYFRLLAEAFGGSCDIVIVSDHDRPIAAVMNFYYRDEVLPYYGGGTKEARQRAGSDFMYWEVMRRAAERGCRLFDFGRSKLGTGSYAFKRNWGFQPMPLHYRYKLGPGQAIPEHNPLNPKYRLFIAAWKRLPLPLANAIGPHIVRGLG